MSGSAPNWTWAVPLVVAIVALIGVFVSVLLQSRNLGRQLKSASTFKIADMRQEWINSLREAMVAFQSYGVTPNLDQRSVREFYQYGTKIELLMNREDPDYAELEQCLYTFLGAETQDEKYAANPGYVAVCQKILRREWLKLKQEIRG